MRRDEAMRAAAETVTIDWEPEREEVAVATAGADAELARVVAFMRADADKLDADGSETSRLQAEAIRELADALAARAHWPKESDDD